MVDAYLKLGLRFCKMVRCQYNAFKPPMAQAAVRSKAVVLLLLIRCLLLLPLWESKLLYVLLYVTLCPFQFYNHLDGEERAGCFAWFVFWCLVMAVWLFLAVPCGHFHLLFLKTYLNIKFGVIVCFECMIFLAHLSRRLSAYRMGLEPASVR